MAFQPVIRPRRTCGPHGIETNENGQETSEFQPNKHEKAQVFDTAIAHVHSYLDFFKRSCGVLLLKKPTAAPLKKPTLFKNEYGGYKRVKVTVVYDESEPGQLFLHGSNGLDGLNSSEDLKSKKGRSPQQMKVNQKLHTHAKHWVERLHFLESKFMELRYMGLIAKSEFFPWNTNESFMYSKNSIKCVYLQLVLLYYGGIIQWCRSESSGSFFYGIESFVVPKEHRVVFDSCAVGSICSKEYKTPSTGDGGLSKKGLVKLWSTCGFIETLDKENGSLVYKYSAAERDKQRKHFANPCLA